MEEFNRLTDGATMRAWEQQMMSFQATWDLFKSSIEGAAIAIGQKLIPVIKPIVKHFTQLFNTLADVNPELLTLGIMAAGAIAAFAPLLWLFASLLNPIGLVVTGVTGLSAAFATNFDNIRDKVRTSVEGVVGDLDWVSETFKTMYDAIFPEEEGKEIELPDTIRLDVSDIIIIESSMSAWDLFVRDGFDEQMSWDAFQADLLAAGWEGGALEIGDRFSLDLTGVEIIPPPVANLEGVATIWGEEIGAMAVRQIPRGMAAGASSMESVPGLWERLLGAVSEVSAPLKVRLDKMWDDTVVWADAKAGEGLNLVAGWFTIGEGGESPITAVLSEVLSGDFRAVINRVIPGAGDDMQEAISQNWPAKIEAALPHVVDGLKNLVNSMGTWLVDEGVPLFSERIGYFAGRVGALFVNGLESVIGMLLGEGDGGSAITDYIDENINAPMNEGFQAGLTAGGINTEGGEVVNWARQIVAGIGAALIGAVLVTGVFSGFSAALALAVGWGLGAVKLGAAMFVSLGAKIWAGIVASTATQGTPMAALAGLRTLRTS